MDFGFDLGAHGSKIVYPCFGIAVKAVKDQSTRIVEKGMGK